MRTLTLQQKFPVNFTAVPNIFFDFYMPRSNGEFVKIYLYIARCLNHPDKTLSIDVLADTFNHTEADIMRALRYWNNEGLLEFIYSEDGRDLTGLSLIYPEEPAGQTTSKQRLPSSGGRTEHSGRTEYGGRTESSGRTEYGGRTGTDERTEQGGSAESSRRMDPSGKMGRDAGTAHSKDRAQDASFPKPPEKTSFSAAQIRQLAEQDEIQELFFLAERYLNRLLNPKDREVLLYLYVDLEFTVDLIIHLLEYCVSNNHASIRYIEKVALDWHAAGVRTVKDAKEQTSQYSSSVISVMRAFGISGRGLGQSERNFISKWNEVYCFTDEMIIEACNRTIQNTHEPSFKYADSILNAWREKNIFTLHDLAQSDREFSSARAVQGKGKSPAKSKPANARQNYIQRDYDFDELERMLIDNNK